MDDRMILRRQLVAQAECLGQLDDTDLVVYILITCSALVDAASGLLPELSGEWTEQVYPAFLRLAKKWEEFSLEKLPAYMGRKGRELAGKAAEMKKRLDELETAALDKRAALHKLESRTEAVSQELREAGERCEKVRREKEQMEDKKAEKEAELGKIKKAIGAFDDDIQGLCAEIIRARDIYREMEAGYPQLARIREGFRSDGYLDMEDFREATRKMNEEAESLLSRYESLLSGILSDVEELQEEIRRRNGMAR